MAKLEAFACRDWQRQAKNNMETYHFHRLGVAVNDEKPSHGDVIKWTHFSRYCPFVRGIHRLPVKSPHKGRWRGALMFSLICAWINAWVNNCEAGDSRRHGAHYDVIVMSRSGDISIPSYDFPSNFRVTWTCHNPDWWTLHRVRNKLFGWTDNIFRDF